MRASLPGAPSSVLDRTLALRPFCAAPQIWGLQPGIHRFKYLVDGCWVIDLAAHTEADSKGNINNVRSVWRAGGGRAGVCTVWEGAALCTHSQRHPIAQVGGSHHCPRSLLHTRRW